MRNGIHPPLSQENVQLSPDFRNCLLKLLGSMPVVMDPANISPVLLSLLGSMAIVNQIIMTKDETTGNYIIRFNVMSQNFTDGAYPHYYQIMNNEVPAAIGIPSQWVEFGIPKGAKWKYYQNGKILVNSWVKSNGKSYYLGADQYMVTGRKKINGNRYYFKSKIEGGKETTGYMVTHWNKIQGKWYYFHSSGKMMTLNWAQDEAKKHWYYCGSDGVMVTSSIIDWKGKKYFVEEDGAMAVNKTIVDPDSGKTYEADENGVLTESSGYTVEIAPWLIGYNGRPSTSGGRRVTYSSNDRQKLKDIIGVMSIDWYSYENQTGPNAYTKTYLKNKKFNIGTNGELTDENGRYWITLGPKVLIPNYPDDGELKTNEFADYIGCRVDVVLYNTKEKKYAYIECVFSGDIKAHTYKNGVYQTGRPYPKSYSAKVEPYKVDYVDGSIVEFTGKNQSSNGSMSKYTVVELVVYS